MAYNIKTVQAMDILGRLAQGQLADATKELRPLRWSMTQKTAVITGSGFGSGLVQTETADYLLAETAASSAYKTLNVRETPTGKTVIPIVTTDPRAAWIVPGLQGAKIAADGTLVGGGVSTESNELVSLVEIAIPLTQDSGVDLNLAMADLFARAFGTALDWACFSADGSVDEIDGGQTGIFAHADVPSASATATKTSVDRLVEGDLLTCVEACADAALMRTPRWWMHPAIYKKLLRVADGSGRSIIKFPVGQPMLVGYPVTLTLGAPSANTAGSKILAFGEGSAYLVAIRQDIQVMISDAVKFDHDLRLVRAILRVKTKMMQPAWFSTLKLAAS